MKNWTVEILQQILMRSCWTLALRPHIYSKLNTAGLASAAPLNAGLNTLNRSFTEASELSQHTVHSSRLQRAESDGKTTTKTTPAWCTVQRGTEKQTERHTHILPQNPKIITWNYQLYFVNISYFLLNLFFELCISLKCCISN